MKHPSLRSTKIPLTKYFMKTKEKMMGLEDSEDSRQVEAPECTDSSECENSTCLRKLQEEKEDMLTHITSQKAASIPVKDLEGIYHTNLEHGMSQDEAVRREKICGPNEFDVKEDDPLWRRYLNQVGPDLS